MRKISGILLSSALIISLAVPAFAEEWTSPTKSEVVFTQDQKLESSFFDNVIDDTIRQNVEPGDTAIFNVTLRNDNSEQTDWWMDKRTIDSLELWQTNHLTNAGGYEYQILYSDKTQTDRVLYDGANLHGTNLPGETRKDLQKTKSVGDKEFIYLGSYAKGEGGVVTLKVSLDGETQGNSYQDTLADIAMEFAVELTPSPTTKKVTKINRISSVNTGDSSNSLPYFIGIGAAGLIVLIIAIYIVVKRRKDRKEAS
jgi:LPXTG-motif cell wall-anchored protein